MTKEKYLKDIMKHLHCSKEEKKKIYSDIDNDITIALEHESLEDIIKRMGSAKEVADEFNHNLGYKKSYKKLWLCIGIIVILIGGYFFFQKSNEPLTIDLSDSQKFSEKVIDQQINKVIECIDQKAYDQLVNDYFSQPLKEALTAKQLEDAFVSIDENLGKYEKIKEKATQIIIDDHQEYAVNEVLVQFENRNIILRLTFDEEMKLSGIFMR